MKSPRDQSAAHIPDRAQAISSRKQEIGCAPRGKNPDPGGELQFSPEQRKLVIHAADDAEERTTRYYCIPPFRWSQLSYDLLTSQDKEWEPLPEPILARVQLLQKIRPEPHKPFDFYRIQLNDPSILTAAQRERLEGDLYPFLVYILTHEMVHLVRLSSILEPEKVVPQIFETETPGLNINS